MQAPYKNAGPSQDGVSGARKDFDVSSVRFSPPNPRPPSPGSLNIALRNKKSSKRLRHTLSYHRGVLGISQIRVII
jgi:hypothetical protein